MIYKTKHITVYIGTDKNKKIQVFPYVWNNDITKVKVLTDGSIFDLHKRSVYSALEKHYNVEMFDIIKLSDIVKAETITSEELNTLKIAIKKFFETENKIVDTENKKTQSEEYRNF
ncbi:MAG: hypothetical protein E7359_01435 [Clostridiales bacterium]|nr:hypothetical protein [Clostridiales bacterium]